MKIQDLRTANVFTFFFILYFHKMSLITFHSLNNILPTNFLFITLTYLSSVFDLFNFHPFLLVMLVNPNQYRGTMRVFNNQKFEISKVRSLYSGTLFKVAATDMRYFARSKLSRSFVQKKNFRVIWQLVFKLGYLLGQER